MCGTSPRTPPNLALQRTPATGRAFSSLKLGVPWPGPLSFGVSRRNGKRVKLTALDCPSFMWGSTYLTVTALVLVVTRAQAPVWSILVGAFVGALALEFSVFKGGECPWLPEALPTKALFHLLAVILGFVVVLPALGILMHGGPFLLFPALLAISFSAFFFVHLREHSGPPRSERSVSVVLHVLAALPFFIVAAGGLLLAALGLWSVVRQALNQGAGAG